MDTPLCPSCGAAAPSRYCMACGERQAVAKPTVVVWLREAAEELFSLDGRVPGTVGLLLFRPGELTRRWSAGQRVRHPPPLRIYLLSSVLFLAVAFSIGPLRPAAPRPAALVQETELRRSLTELAIVFVPALALLLTVLYAGARRYFVEHVVFSLHYGSFVFLILSLGWGVAAALPPLGEDVVIPAVLVAVLYMVPALRRAYASGWLTSTLRVAAVVGLVVVTTRGVASVMGMRYAGRLADTYRETIEIAEGQYVDWKAHSNPGSEEARATAAIAFASYRGVLGSGLMSDHHRFHLGDLELALALPTEAARVAEEVVAREPGDLLALLLRARSRAALGDHEGAAADYRRIMGSDEAEVRRQRDGYAHHPLPFPDVLGEARTYLGDPR